MIETSLSMDAVRQKPSLFSGINSLCKRAVSDQNLLTDMVT